MDELIEIILYTLFSIPGAILRWLLGGCRKPMKHYLEDDVFLNGIVFVFFIVLIMVIVNFLF